MADASQILLGYTKVLRKLRAVGIQNLPDFGTWVKEIENMNTLNAKYGTNGDEYNRLLQWDITPADVINGVMTAEDAEEFLVTHKYGSVPEEQDEPLHQSQCACGHTKEEKEKGLVVTKLKCASCPFCGHGTKKTHEKGAFIMPKVVS